MYDTLVGRRRTSSGENAMSELLARFKKRAAAAALSQPLRCLKPSIESSRKCLEPAAKDRFQTTHELVAALEARDGSMVIRSPRHR